MFYVYLLECADTTYYVGCTNNLERRIHQHNTAKSGAHYTKIRRPVVLKYTEEYQTLAEGRKREAEMKKLKRQQKKDLINDYESE
jgi:putative endonuclease